MPDMRYARAGDFQQVFSLLEALWPEMSLDFEETEDAYGEYLDSATDFCLCMAEGDELIGFCAANIKRNLQFAGLMVYVDILIVKESFRKTGVGAALLEEAGEIGTKRGCRAMQLDSGFQRTGAHEFYGSLGFKQMGIFFGKML